MQDISLCHFLRFSYSILNLDTMTDLYWAKRCYGVSARWILDWLISQPSFLYLLTDTPCLFVYFNKPPEWVLINSTVSYHSKWEAYDPKKWLGKGGRLEKVRLCPRILEKDEWRQRDLKKPSPLQKHWNSCYCIGTNSCYCLNTTWSVTSSMTSPVFYDIRDVYWWQHRLLAVWIERWNHNNVSKTNCHNIRLGCKDEEKRRLYCLVKTESFRRC